MRAATLLELADELVDPFQPATPTASRRCRWITRASRRKRLATRTDRRSVRRDRGTPAVEPVGRPGGGSCRVHGRQDDACPACSLRVLLTEVEWNAVTSTGILAFGAARTCWTLGHRLAVYQHTNAEDGSRAIPAKGAITTNAGRRRGRRARRQLGRTTPTGIARRRHFARVQLVVHKKPPQGSWTKRRCRPSAVGSSRRARSSGSVPGTWGGRNVRDRGSRPTGRSPWSAPDRLLRGEEPWHSRTSSRSRRDTRTRTRWWATRGGRGVVETLDVPGSLKPDGRLGPVRERRSPTARGARTTL